MIPSSQKNLKRILVLGVGGSGCSCVANYSKLNKSLSYMLMDSDKASLSNFNSDNIKKEKEKKINELKLNDFKKIIKNVLTKENYKRCSKTFIPYLW